MKAIFRHYQLGKLLNRDGVNGDPWFVIRDALAAARAAGQLGVHRSHAATVAVGLFHHYGYPMVKGATICQFTDDTGIVLATGYAFCSTKDQFCRRIGRQIAEGRARGVLKQQQPWEKRSEQ